MYKVLGIHFSFWLVFLSPLRLFARLNVKPSRLSGEHLKEKFADQPVVFVMPRFQLLDIFMLNVLLSRSGLSAIKQEARSNSFTKTAVLALRSKVWLFYPAARRNPFTECLADILEKDTRLQGEGLLIQPVSVFWSRAAEKTERNFLLRSLFPDDGNANFLQKLLLFAFHQGTIDIHFGDTHVLRHDSVPVFPHGAAENREESSGVQDGDVLPDLPSQCAPGERGAEGESLTALERASRFRRVLQAEINREKTAALGPTLYDFNTVANWILGGQEMQKILQDSSNHLRSQRKAYRYLEEIAANYNYTTIRALSFALDLVWTRIFKGVRVRNFDAVRDVARTGHVLWMPCHRSHVDYMLLSYLLHRSGLAAPHIGAGVNLSFWPAGPIFRRGGAFFLRRSFSGNRLYTKVFAGYIDFLMHNGYGIEFFQEGGRSRIGKLLSPKYGLMKFCVNSILQRKAANTFIVPIFIGYDKVMEDDSYAREVSGAKKQKESAWQLLRSIRFLFSNYGRVDVSFGKPIHFGRVWTDFQERSPQLSQFFRRSRQDEEAEPPQAGFPLESLPDDIDSRHPIVQGFIEFLALRVNQGINSAAVASGTSLLASVALAHEERTFQRVQLREQFERAARIVEMLRGELGWLVSNSFIATEGSFAFAKGSATFSEDAGEADAAREEEESSVVQKRMESQKAQAAFDESLAACVKWEFFEAVEAGENTEGGQSYRLHESKCLNLYWYRGTVFHVFAVAAIVAKFLLQARLRENFHVAFADLLAGFEQIRAVWSDELFWPDQTSSEQLVGAALRILAEFGAVQISDDQVTISSQEAGRETLKFVAGLIAAEKEIYGLQLTSAMQLLGTQGEFKRAELINHSFQLHRSAFLRGLVSQPASLSRVYGARCFEALFKRGVYVPKEGQALKVSFERLQPLIDFFDMDQLRDVSI